MPKIRLVGFKCIFEAFVKASFAAYCLLFRVQNVVVGISNSHLFFKNNRNMFFLKIVKWRSLFVTMYTKIVARRKFKRITRVVKMYS